MILFLLHPLSRRQQVVSFFSLPVCVSPVEFTETGVGGGGGAKYYHCEKAWYLNLSYRPARLHRLAESIPGLLKILQIRALIFIGRNDDFAGPAYNDVSMAC
jgi:hypothetical protein